MRPFRILRALEFLGPKQGVGEVDEQPRRHDAGEPIVEDHGRCPLKPVAGVRVSNRSDEEAKTESDQDDVQHAMFLLTGDVPDTANTFLRDIKLR